MRYLPLTDTDRSAMLARIGAPSVDALFVDVPEAWPRAGTAPTGVLTGPSRWAPLLPAAESEAERRAVAPCAVRCIACQRLAERRVA